MVTYDYSSKNVLIIGCASGIGRATALAFAKSKARLFIADKQDDGLQEIKEEAAKYTHVNSAVVDVRDEKRLIEIHEQAVSLMGSIDCAINNAGISGSFTNLVESETSEWNNVLDTNLKSIYISTRSQLKQMIQQKSGSIINIGSVLSFKGGYGLSPYCSSKAGVIQLTRTAAIESAKHGIRVNAICPGGIETPLLRKHFSEIPNYEQNLLKTIPMRRLGKPQEVAEAALWLGSQAASYVTGQSIVIDGGFSA